MKVLNVEVHNVMKVRDVKFDLEGHNLFLVGGMNDQGKTSALTALLMALCGRRDMESYPEIALKTGEEKGWVKVDLSGDADLHEDNKLTVELLLKRKRSGEVVEEFRVLDSAGEEAPEPRSLLRRLYDLKAFDPLSFERLDKKAKKALVQKVCGLDFEPSDKLHAKKYTERAAINKEGSALKAKFDKMAVHAGVPAEEVSVTDLMAEEEQRKKINQSNKKVRDTATDTAKRVPIAAELARKVSEEVFALEEKLIAAKNRLESAKIDLADLRKESQIRDESVLKLIDADESEVRKQIAESGEINRKVRENQERAKAKSQLESLREQSEKLTADMNEIKETQQKMMQNAPWPVEGMGMDSEGLTYNGLPFEQSSKALRTRVSVKIGMALNPKLRLLVCQAGGDCDVETLNELETILAENDFQMLLEIVTRGAEDEARCAVIMKDGAIVGAEEDADEPEPSPAKEQEEEVDIFDNEPNAAA